MSSNNQLIIRKRNKYTNKWDIYMNYCVDNEFEYNKEDIIKTTTSLIQAIKWCNKYMKENLVEYGYYVEGLK